MEKFQNVQENWTQVRASPLRNPADRGRLRLLVRVK